MPAAATDFQELGYFYISDLIAPLHKKSGMSLKS